MAGRSRTLTPEMIEDTTTASLSHLEWRLFVSLILLADDYGNLRAETAYLRGQALWACETPLDDVQNALNKLARVQLTTTYRVRGQNYLHLTTWDRHQKVDKPGKPRMPGPDQSEDMSNQTLMPFSRDSRETLAPDLRPPTIDPDRDLRPVSPSGKLSTGPDLFARRPPQPHRPDAFGRQLERIEKLREEEASEADDEAPSRKVH